MNNPLNNTLPINNQFNNTFNPFNYNLNDNHFINSTMPFPNFMNNNNVPPFIPFNIGFPNLNRNLNPQMNQNFNNFNFIGFNDFLNNRNDSHPRLNLRIRNSSSDLNDNSDIVQDEYTKLKNQFIKELDEFQYKNKDKFDDTLIENECSICLCKYKNTDILKLLPCKHPFHKKCIKKWLSNEEHNKCPLCNFDIKSEIQKKKEELNKHIYEEEHAEDDD
jgi:hypothetical protein